MISQCSALSAASLLMLRAGRLWANTLKKASPASRFLLRNATPSQAYEKKPSAVHLTFCSFLCSIASADAMMRRRFLWSGSFPKVLRYGALARDSRKWNRGRISLSTIFVIGRRAAKAKKLQSAFAQSIVKWWKKACGAVELVRLVTSSFTTAG